MRAVDAQIHRVNRVVLQRLSRYAGSLHERWHGGDQFIRFAFHRLPRPLIADSMDPSSR